MIRVSILTGWTGYAFNAVNGWAPGRFVAPFLGAARLRLLGSGRALGNHFVDNTKGFRLLR